MQYSNQCGCQMDDAATTCPNCGGAVHSQASNPTPHFDNVRSTDGNGYASAGLALGIIGCVFAWFAVRLGLAVGGVGLAMSFVAAYKHGKRVLPAILVSVAALLCALINLSIGGAF